jgi:peptidoglycan/xylan/chitin deacetylase (PgdA/CDA1 family)
MKQSVGRRDFLAAIAAAPILTSTVLAPASAEAAWPKGTITKLPEGSDAIAWTVDDGVSYETVSKFVDFCEAKNVRLTFFVTAMYSSWVKVQPRLQPLVDSGQVQLANHTLNHPDLTRLSASQVQRQLLGCEKFIEDHYGVTAKPYFRPPYGSLNSAVAKAAAEIGYTTPVMWHGSLGDASNTSSAKILSMAEKWMTEDRILISHANQPAVTRVFKQINSLLNRRKLETVTLTDVFG